jgi:ribosomal protein S18 acetylase RimI-like enzyme
MRRAEPADLSAVIELTRRAYGPYEAELGGLPIPVTEDYRPRIARGEIWLLEEVDRTAGLIVLEEQGRKLHIFSVAVDPARQHTGVGRRLFAFAEQMARRRDFALLDLCTNAKMQRNIDIYRRWGFAETGRRPHPERAGWILVDMEKRLLAADMTRAI